MCRALEEWREEGVQLGYEIGETRFKLINKLCQLGRVEEVSKIATDADYLQKLKDEFHIS